MFWRLTEDFCWRTTRAWRTFGINAGIVWFNLDYGYGKPGWTYPNIWNQYGPGYSLKESDELPDGKPSWAFPSWDIYRKGNLDFLGWIAGWPRITDRRHAYYPGETVEKQAVMMWDRFDTRTFTMRWTATVGGKKVGGGSVSRPLVSNVPAFEKISFAAPAVEKKTAGEIRAVFLDDEGREVFVDTAAFEVFPPAKKTWPDGLSYALYDPDGKTAGELAKLGLPPGAAAGSAKDAAGKDRLIVGAFALGGKDGWSALPMDAVEKGLHVLVLPQTADAWKAFGFDVQDRLSRILFVRDNARGPIAALDGDCVREWNGAPRTKQKNAWGNLQHGSLVKHKKHEMRWTYNMAVAALQLRSPGRAGWTPQIEGEFDMNYSALLEFRHGKGSVRFCTLDFLSRVHTGAKEDDPLVPATDPAVEKTARAVLGDFFLAGGVPATRAVVPSGSAAERIARMAKVACSPSRKLEKGDLLLVGSDSTLTADKILAAARKGANVLVVANDAVAKGLGFTLSPCGPDVFWVPFDHANTDLRGIGQSQLRWRARMKYSVLGGAPKGWKIDAAGLFASTTVDGSRIFVSSYDPFYLEEKMKTDTHYEVRKAPLTKIEDKHRELCAKRCDLSFERSRQFTARLLTNLGAKSEVTTDLYSGLRSDFDPYEYIYW
jgi:hypothetical protein